MDFADIIVDAVDEMLEHGGEQPSVLGVALHAHVSGHPFACGISAARF